MIYLITGATHSGKTLLAQSMMEELKVPYLSLDLLKMGLIKSNYLDMSPEDSITVITNKLWPLVHKIIETALENNQHLIVEGSYIPFNYKEYFDSIYHSKIDWHCLVMSTNYIKSNYDAIIENASAIETRFNYSAPSANYLIEENFFYIEGCTTYKLPYTFIDNKNTD